MYRFNANIVFYELISRTSQWEDNNNNNDSLENCSNIIRASIIRNFSAPSYDSPCIWMWLSVYMRNKSITSITSSPSKSNYFLVYSSEAFAQYACNRVTHTNTLYSLLIIHYNKSPSSSVCILTARNSSLAHHRRMFQLFEKWLC